jgi:hypothetical protein
MEYSSGSRLEAPTLQTRYGEASMWALFHGSDSRVDLPVWAAAAVVSVVPACWKWRDYRELVAHPELGGTGSTGRIGAVRRRPGPGRSGRAGRPRSGGAERDLRVWPSGRRVKHVLACGGSLESLRALVTQLEEGVTSCEEVVGAAAAYVAEGGRATRAQPRANPVTDAADQLRGIALGSRTPPGQPPTA